MVETLAGWKPKETKKLSKKDGSMSSAIWRRQKSGHLQSKVGSKAASLDRRMVEMSAGWKRKETKRDDFE